MSASNNFIRAINIEALPKCLYNFLDGINGKEIRFNEDETFTPASVIKENDSRLKMLRQQLATYWKIYAGCRLLMR